MQVDNIKEKQKTRRNFLLCFCTCVSFYVFAHRSITGTVFISFLRFSFTPTETLKVTFWRALILSL